MDETIAIILLAPFYGASVAAVWWGLAYGWHMLRRVDQSAVETKLTETLRNGNNVPPVKERVV